MRAKLLISGVILLVILSGCKPFINPEDPGPYTGGDVGPLTFQIVGPGVVKIFWTENFADEDGFYVDRRRWDGHWESRILQAYPDQVCITDIFAELGEVYFYRVYAFKGGSLSEPSQAQLDFYLPAPRDVDYEVCMADPDSIRFFWTNDAVWADSIVVGKRIEGQDWMHGIATLNGDAIQWTDTDYDVSQAATWSFTAHFHEHLSSPAYITMVPPKSGY